MKYISSFIKKNLANDSLETVLVKVMLINDFYGTNVYDVTLSVAKHILSISEIDTRMMTGVLIYT
ncbi:hypothetical protein [Pseudobutyrivibrio xylanivorans]|uniref:Uncharacterized protein n=1 Tax=Pseudobutyrivibrio xylanivorans TaxID=185007 RepID=A0A5P6VU76_PSEXY|nr:hypothetical protein [Pseudobutyrivibrio xylanivorans]QFJ56285.1 hypothetical protein FXF36_15310 [Pseudobutyrivibrio xylanivorans]